MAVWPVYMCFPIVKHLSMLYYRVKMYLRQIKICPHTDRFLINIFSRQKKLPIFCENELVNFLELKLRVKNKVKLKILILKTFDHWVRNTALLLIAMFWIYFEHENPSFENICI